MSVRFLLRILAAGVLALLAVLGAQLHLGRQVALGQAEQTVSNLALTLDRQFDAVLRRMEADLHAIAERLPPQTLQPKAAGQHQRPMRELLRPYLRHFPEVDGFYVWSATDGTLLYGTAPVSADAPRPSIATRPGFIHLKNHPEARAAFSDVIRGVVSGRQTIAVYVPVRDARQQLQAVLTATLNLARIAQSFEALNLPPRSVIYLRRSDDHRLLIRYPYLDSELNKPIRSPITERIDAGETSGSARYRAWLDGEPRIYGFRKLESYPFYVIVGLSESAALQSWRHNAWVVGLVLAGLSVALMAAIVHMLRLERLRLAAQQDVERAHELLHDAVDSIPVGLVIYDPQGRLIMVNEALLQMFEPIRDVLQPGRTSEEITRTALQRGLYPQVDVQAEEWLARRLRQYQQADGRPHELALADGRWIEFSEHRTPRGYVVGSRIDITSRKRLEMQLRELASTDELTGLANRRQFMQRLEEELQRVRRQTTRAACVLMLDLDHFKRVNDQHGHATGDRLLQHFAELLRQELRGADTAARLGGEEFAVILPGTDLTAAQGIAQRICERLAAQPLNVGTQQQLGVTVSVGVASIGVADLSADAVLARADAALYRAKMQGRNRVVVAPV